MNYKNLLDEFEAVRKKQSEIIKIILAKRHSFSKEEEQRCLSIFENNLKASLDNITEEAQQV